MGTAGRFGLAGTIGLGEASNFVEQGANELVVVELVQSSGFLKDLCGPKDAVGHGAVSALRPARPSQQHPMQKLEGLV